MNVSNCSLKDECQFVKDLQQENKQLRDNWNYLKGYLEHSIDWEKIHKQDNSYEEIYEEILDKMQELEGSDSNENNK